VIQPAGGGLAPGARVSVTLPFTGDPGHVRLIVFAGTLPGGAVAGA
jgi:hypothetical protein